MAEERSFPVYNIRILVFILSTTLMPVSLFRNIYFDQEKLQPQIPAYSGVEQLERFIGPEGNARIGTGVWQLA